MENRPVYDLLIIVVVAVAMFGLGWYFGRNAGYEDGWWDRGFDDLEQEIRDIRGDGD